MHELYNAGSIAHQARTPKILPEIVAVQMQR